MKIILLLILPFVFLTSCIEIIDDLKFNSDGSGTFKYAVNLSASKVKINSILALDSIDGKKVPDISDIRTKINEVEKLLSSKTGITNVKIDQNYSDYIFKLECDFTNVLVLQNAIKEIIKEESKNSKLKFLDDTWLVLTKDKLERNIPEMTIDLPKSIKEEDKESLNKGSYVCITRFEKPITKTSNENAKISPNNLNVMVRTNIFSLIQNPKLLENVIYF